MTIRMMERKKISQAIVVEGRDDVDAVNKACEALIIPTHGFGITAETWKLIEKAAHEKGIIILTDPDFSGEEIRRKLTERFPGAIQAYISQEAATMAGDIGVENAKPEIIAEALSQALALSEHALAEDGDEAGEVDMNDLIELGLSACEGSNELRAKLCAKLGIGYGNANALLKKLKYWKIGYEEIEQAIKEIKE